MDRMDMSALNINDETTTLSEDEHTKKSLFELSTTSMDKMDIEENNSGEVVVNNKKPRRSSRKRAPRSLVVIENEKKLKKYDLSNEKDIEKYYLDKKIKLTHSLETIFEEPQDGNVMTNRRFKRAFKFEPNVEIVNINKMKAKKRSARAKKLCETVKKLKKKLPMGLLLEKLSCLDDVQYDEHKIK